MRWSHFAPLLSLLLAACEPVGGDVASVLVFGPESPEPVAGATVLFHAADGTLLDSVVTDADGRATGAIDAGGMVTVAYPSPIRKLISIGGVMPGDELQAGQPRRYRLEQTRMMTVTMPTAFPGAHQYSVYAGCADALTHGELVMQLRLHDGCPAFGPIVATAYAADGNLAYALIPAADLSRDAVTMPEWRTDFDNVSVTVAGGGPYSTYAFARNGFYAYGGDSSSEPTGGPGTMRYVPDVGSAYRYQITSGGADNRSSVITRNSPSLPANVHLDEAAFVPAPTAPQLDGGRVSWTHAAGAANVDGTYVRLAFGANAADWAMDWSFALPAGATHVDLPTLPEELGYTPGPVLIQAVTQAVDASWVTPETYRLTAGGGWPAASYDADLDLPETGELRVGYGGYLLDPNR